MNPLFTHIYGCVYLSFNNEQKVFIAVYWTSTAKRRILVLYNLSKN